MTPEMRYMVANARLASLSDPQAWTMQDLQDVFALTVPSVPFEDWLRRIQPAPAPAPAAMPDDPDPETTRTMQALLGPEGKRLQDLGVLSIKEGLPE